MEPTKISVVIPCFNEGQVIYSNIKKIAQYLSSRFATFEIIIVSDGSTDNTVKEATRAQEELPGVQIRIIANPRNQGKGQAVKDGALKSQYDVIMFLDADLTIPIEELEKFLPFLETSDILIASRLLPETVFKEKNPWYRTILARGFQIIQILILGNSEIIDSQCGFKVFKKDVALHIFPLLTIKRFAFDAEILFLANKLGYSIKQLPVTIQKDNRESHIRFISDPINMFLSLLKIRMNSVLGKYKIS